MKRWLKTAWPYWAGGILLGALNVLLLASSGTVWQVSGGYLLWAGGILEWFGVKPFQWDYFRLYNTRYDEIISGNSAFFNQYTLLNLGVVFGALIAALLASQFKLGKIKNGKQAAYALLGGILMGYGSRLTGGCNIGSFFSGIPSFSLHAWVFWIFVSLGAWAGTKLLIKIVT
ncbi:YeeE/YedE family protein [Caproiciproducens sp. NJN-50]|uniref:YeeE/YedE thiosulfate transporter family protein n=1 Tax=Acutalibacteraceae TaxID=3082771 RepID=UPI000FFDFF8D|nr:MULTISPECIES: YeeE/YedE thiosulfate transporter family protein [Acutalibacteraceae]QAT48893.1 YeeE/YedE family protein [Caproiciproducens sp. NJN-50]